MGFFSLGMARLVGDEGRVLSVDIQQRMLNMLKKRARKAHLLSRIQLVKCEPGAVDVKAEADFILYFWMVHEVPDSAAFFGQLPRHINPNGELLIAEPKNHVSDDDCEKTLHLMQESGFKLSGRPNISMSKAAVFVAHTA